MIFIAETGGGGDLIKLLAAVDHQFPCLGDSHNIQIFKYGDPHLLLENPVQIIKIHIQLPGDGIAGNLVRVFPIQQIDDLLCPLRRMQKRAAAPIGVFL